MAETTVGIIMGSQSDWPTMRQAAKILDELDVPYGVTNVQPGHDALHE